MQPVLLQLAPHRQLPHQPLLALAGRAAQSRVLHPAAAQWMPKAMPKTPRELQVWSCTFMYSLHVGPCLHVIEKRLRYDNNVQLL